MYDFVLLSYVLVAVFAVIWYYLLCPVELHDLVHACIYVVYAIFLFISNMVTGHGRKLYFRRPQVGHQRRRENV